MKHPMVPVYKYSFVSPCVAHFIKIYRETSDGMDFCVGCTVGRKDNMRKKVSIIFLCDELVEKLEPDYYISYALASKLLKQMKEDSPPNWIQDYVDMVMELSETYAREFEKYALYRKQEKATHKIQKVFLENYYNPNTAFCQGRLQRDLKRLQPA